MQCPKCGLQNMPGTTHCFQCQTDLSAGETAPPQLYPPRAERRGIAEGLKREKPAGPPRIATTAPSALGAFGPYLRRGLCSLLPGIGQYRNGEKRKAKYFFISTGLLVVFHAAFFFTPVSDWLVPLTVGLLGYGMLDAIMVAYGKATGTRIWDNFGILGGMGLCVASILLAVYASLYMSFGLFYLRGAIPDDILDFSRGDTILARRVAGAGLQPRRGDLLIGRGGNSLEWILALPGETVTSEKGSLKINGNPLTLPQNVPRVLEGLKVEVPPDSYFTLQSVFYRRRGEALDDAIVRATYITVPGTSLLGKVVAVMGPPTRRRLIRSHS